MADQAGAWRPPAPTAGLLKDRDVDEISEEERAGRPGREWETVPPGQWERSAGWVRTAAEDVAAGRVDTERVALPGGRATGLAAALSTRAEPGQQRPLRHLANELSRYPQARSAGGGGGSSTVGTALATAATVGLQATRTGQAAIVLALVVELVRLADTLAQLNETRQQLEYARALRRSTQSVVTGMGGPNERQPRGRGESEADRATSPTPPATTAQPAPLPRPPRTPRVQPGEPGRPPRDHDTGVER